ncbi:alpha/beta hydrolase [Pararhodobacter sp.]|uniref:alpha/beta hydrolase n=1 Tax=Pararhodobacter sp. TaxID=2127056 RepID=UPI002AFE78B6|nr:alpha/beta hydrolase [Pararhodobacter sp.]
MTDDLTLAYENQSFVPGFDAISANWTVEAEALRRRLGDRAQTGLRYGQAPRQTFDLFLPDVTHPVGLMVFIHGGYWLATSPSTWSHLAAGALARDWAVAMPGYTLAPEARIHTITNEVETAIFAAAQIVTGPIVVTGHSAGGHLSARMACTDRTPDWAARLVRVVPISPVSDLAPLRHTAMNATLKIDAAEAATESPARLTKRDDVDCTIWVGGQERPAFLWQARLLSENWDCPWHVDPGKHHFDVIDALKDAESPLIQTLLD